MWGSRTATLDVHPNPKRAEVSQKFLKEIAAFKKLSPEPCPFRGCGNGSHVNLAVFAAPFPK